MPRIRAFDGYLVDAARAARVVSPAYDSVSPSVRRRFAEDNPQNYLNTMRLREDFPADAQPSVDELLALNKSCLEKLLSDGSFHAFDTPSIFIYRLTADGHSQTGIVCEVSVDEYHGGRLRKHENTRSDKEDLLAMYQKVVGVSSSPICLAYPHDETIEKLLTQIAQQSPMLDFVSTDGVSQKVWRADDSQREKLQALFDRIEVTYLTDGHHRAASGWRYAQMRREQDGNNGDESYNQLLVALFSTAQLSLLPFHRAVKELNISPEDLLAALEKDFTVTALTADEHPAPRAHGEFGMLLNDNWYRLRTRDELVNAADPVNSLDVSILQNHILQPILGITDPRSDPRLDYVSGTMGLKGLQQKCADGWAVCFACFATSIEQLMAVADAGALMPPKSTYFTPKANSGVFIRRK